MLDFKGIKSTFLSALGISGLFFGLIHFEALWQDKLTIINYLVFPLLIITAVFATQFNRSRIAILCLLWGLYLISEHSTFTWSKWLVGNSQWLLLCGASLLLLLAFMKDRAIFSVHTLTRVVLIVFCGGITFAWLKVSGSFIELFPNTETWKQITPYIPIFLPLRVIGIVLLWRSLRNHDLTQTILLVTFVVWYLNQLHVITLPWSVIAVAMASIYLLAVSTDSYYLAYRDDLTSLPTRRALNQLALSLGRKYTVAMLDIDHFKKFNDTWGHLLGDQVLKAVGRKINESMRDESTAYRFGGEEFVMLLPKTNVRIARHFAETTRKQFEKLTLKDKRSGQMINNITASFGVVESKSGESISELIARADDYLYKAKRLGRNRVLPI